MDTENNSKLRVMAAAIVFSGETIQEVEFKYSAFKILMSADVGDPDDGTIDYYQILDAVEPIAGFWGEDRIRRAIDEMGVLERVEDSADLYVRKRSLKLESISGEIYRGAPTEVSMKFLAELEDHSQVTVNFTRNKLVEILRASHKNSLGIISASNRSLPSPFFAHENGEKLKPFTPNSSLTAAFDQLSLYAEISDFVPALKTVMPLEEVALVRKTLEVAIDTQLPDSDPYGDGGGLALLGADEDYPGSDRPSVPSNALFLICARLIEIFVPSAFSKDVEIAVSKAANFIFRHQLPNGMWGVHSYPESYFGSDHIRSAHIFFSSLAVTGLKLWDGRLDETQGSRFRDAMKKTARGVLRDAMVHADNTNHGMDPKYKGEPAATAHSVSVLLATLDYLEEQERENSLEKIQSSINWIASNWNISNDLLGNVDLIRFRPPTTRGPADTFMTWEQPGDAQVLSILSSASTHTELEISDLCWEKMELACQKIAQNSWSGYWMDVGLKDKIQVSNSATCAMAIAKFLAATRRIDG